MEVRIIMSLTSTPQLTEPKPQLHNENLVSEL